MMKAIQAGFVRNVSEHNRRAIYEPARCNGPLLRIENRRVSRTCCDSRLLSRTRHSLLGPPTLDQRGDGKNRKHGINKNNDREAA